tara:strand:+ start:238 stop:687 length:450 start_codon:yes stop_codon:yes gene_type:complete
MVPVPDTIKNYVIPVLGIVVVGGVAYVAYQYTKKDEIPKLAKNPDYPDSELSDVEASAIAERLYAAMVTTFAANKEETATIVNALQNLTQNDFIKVYEKFGARQYSKFWKNEGDPFTSDDLSLLAWLSYELSPENFAKIKQLIPEALNY